jgi:hypothetical protein
MTAMNLTINDELDVIAALSERAIEASIHELSHRDRLTLALRSAIRSGVDINDLSALSGLTPEDIRNRCSRELHVLNDLELAAGMV